MADDATLGNLLAKRGISRRAFLKYAAYTASSHGTTAFSVAVSWPRPSPRPSGNQ